jgi:hypothetical protein
LTARDLYELAVTAGADPTIAGAMRDQHQAFAQALAGQTGISANTRNDEVFDAARAGFDTSDTVEMATAAHELESIASATHTELLGQLTDEAAARLVASIAIIEARHATVMASASGRESDLDALLSNSAEPLALEGLR